MLHRNFAVGLHAVPSRHPLALAVSASVAAHAALAVTLIGATAEMGRDREPDMVVDVDLDIAPAAPEGFDPLDRATTLVEEPAARADPEEAEETGAPEKPGEPTASALEPAPDEAKEKEQRKKEEREQREKARREQREREEKERAEKEAAEEAKRAEAERGANQTDRDAGPD
ncbi:MAG TPA: hypothetical protein VEL05_10330, partial [Candidatus Acidoferrum sp.]|nr:hypothetical protein [Candidatus Acidoferrum sp.]